MVEIVDTTLRDAHQSLIATRLSTEDMLPILDLIDQAGFYSIEMWGGATFDVMLRYLKEDPWERLRIIRERVRRTKLQMLLRGQNLVGYRHYPDDVVEKFVELSYRNGIEVFRVFDALNDVRNMATSIRKARELGAIVQGTITYTVSPVHTLEYYVKLAGEIASLEVDHIVIKDMAGLLDPYTTFNLVKEIKSRLKIPVDVHSHFTGGLAIANYVKAVEAGADFVDTSISPLAYGTGQPGIQSFYYALPEGLKPRVNMGVVGRISSYLEKLLFSKYKSLLDVRVFMPDPNVLEHQIPGGMITNFLQQLKQLGAEDKLQEVLEEVRRVREDLGWPPLVTPTSQIVGAQALLNVLNGRYRVVTKEVRDYVKGLYGRPPAPIKKDVIEVVLKGEEPISVRPADLLKPALEECRKALVEKGFNPSEEQIVTYCIFPDLALEFFEKSKPVSKTKLEKAFEELYDEVLGATL
jgi:pyruvate carboxylase subunit B